MDPKQSYILSVPTELLLMIFGNLSNIEKHLRLARTCRKLYSFFKSYETDLWLATIVSWTRAAIRQEQNANLTKHTSECHKYDLPLCYLIDAMHGGEDITLKLPPSTSLRLLDSCLNSNPNALPTTDDTKKRFLQWIRYGGGRLVSWEDYISHA